MFFSLANKFIPISVVQKNDLISITGLDVMVFMGDLVKLWKTQKVQTYLIGEDFSRWDIRFRPFFLYDMDFIINLMITEHRKKRLNTPLRHLVEVQGVLRNGILKGLYSTPELKFNNGGERISQMKPLPHQAEFFEAFDRNIQRCNLTGYLLNSKPGTGKTLASIMMGNRWDEKAIKINVVQLNSVDEVWRATYEGKLTVQKKVWYSNSGQDINDDYDVYVVHYQSLGEIVDHVKRKGIRKAFVTVDECHNFNDDKSLRSILLIELIRYLKLGCSLFMSGTPFKAIGLEAITLLKCIDPTFDDDSCERFRKLFGKSQKRALEILANRIGLISHLIGNESKGAEPIVEDVKIKIPNGKNYTLKVLKENMRDYVEERHKYYMKNLPDISKRFWNCINIVENTVGKTDAQYRNYRMYLHRIMEGYDPKLHIEEAIYCNKYEKEVIHNILPKEKKFVFRDEKSAVKYLNLKIQGEALGNILGKKRSECHVEMARHTDFKFFIDGVEKKTVIFTSYVNVVDEVARLVVEKGFTPRIVYGDTNKDLKPIVREFYDSPAVNPLIATFQSLSTAVPLTAANQVLMLNNPFRSNEEEQAIARVARLGQDKQVYVFKTLLDTGNEENISTRSKDIMEWSRHQVAILLGDSKLETGPVMENEGGLVFDDRVFSMEMEASLESALTSITSVRKNTCLFW